MPPIWDFVPSMRGRETGRADCEQESVELGEGGIDLGRRIADQRTSVRALGGAGDERRDQHEGGPRPIQTETSLSAAAVPEARATRSRR